MKIVSSQPGQKQFLVASNAPFRIISQDIIGMLDVKVQSQGHVGGFQYGGASQLPGRSQGCHIVTSSMPTTIYQAYRKTAARRGSLSSQAVLVTINYDKTATPDISVSADKLRRPDQNMQPC